MAELAKNVLNFDKKNANLIVIGSGDPRHFEKFRKITGYDGKLLSDPSRQAFTLLGFTSIVTGMMGMKSITKVLSAVKGGYKQGAIQGSALQLGGAVIIDPSGTVRYFLQARKPATILMWRICLQLLIIS